MSYPVVLSARAETEIREIYDYIRRHGPANADDWKDRLSHKLASLELFPEGCGIAPENVHARQEIRETFFGPFRILFSIGADQVAVLTVRHGARRFMKRREIDEIL